MPSLMTIPREIRNQICDLVFCGSTNERPGLNKTFEEMIQERVQFQRPELSAWSSLVLGNPQHHISNIASMLLVNRQLYAEVLENTKLIPKTATYDLDVILLDEILPLTTWTYVPFLTQNVDNLNATFRISGSYKFENDRRFLDEKTGKRVPGPYLRFGPYKGFRMGNGAGPAIGWQIYGILERFIKVGPTPERSEGCEHKHMTIKTLNINVETPPGIDRTRFSAPRSRHWPRSSNSDTDVLDPEILARFIGSDLAALLNGHDHEWFQYGKILYEHVDSIIVTRDGDKVVSFDVAEKLEEVGGFGQRYVPEQKLSEYKEYAWRKRKERGLKVLV